MQVVIARRYAQAFLNSFNKNIPHELVEKLNHLFLFLNQHKDALSYLKLSCVPSKIKKEMLEQVCEQYGLKDFLHPLITVLAEHKRLWLFVSVIQILRALYKEFLGIIEWSIRSFPVLTEPELQHIVQFIEQKTEKKAHYTYTSDEELIAGVRIQSDSYVWEHSVQQILRSLNNTVNGVDCGN
ncbi:MAG: ATP synthase F1 subunit delta [Candidatus Babeliaceae bacterium]